MRPLALLLSLLAVSTATSARELPTAPAEVPRFLVVVIAGDDDTTRVEALYTALEAAGARVVDRAARQGIDLPLAPALYTDATLDEPRAALLAARASLRELALDDVDSRLEESLQAALRLPNPSEHKELLADILLLRAEMSLARNLPDEAHKELRLLARLDERREELHPGLFPPNVVAAYERARADNEGAAPAYLAIAADAAGAPLSVLVDGREIASADARAGLDVGAGPHLVTLLAPGRISRSFVVDVSPSEPLSLAAQLFAPRADEDRAAALASLRASLDDEDALTSLLAATGASALLVLAGEDAFTFSASRGRVPLDVADASALELARAALVAAQPAVVVAEVSPAPPSAAVSDEQEPSVLSLVVAGGVVVSVLVAVGAGIGALAWALQPAEPIDPPPVPVAITCCGEGR